MEKVRRQHYVPRMYLKRFGYGNIGDEYISVLKLDNGTVLDNRKVENFAVANYFYDADKEQIAEILKEDLKVFPELCDNENLSDEVIVTVIATGFDKKTREETQKPVFSNVQPTRRSRGEEMGYGSPLPRIDTSTDDDDDDGEVLGSDYDLPPFLRDKNF